MRLTKIYSSLILLFFLASCKQKEEVKSGDKVYQTSVNSSIAVSKNGNDYMFEKSETKFDVIELKGLNPATVVVTIEQMEKRSLSQDPYAKKNFVFTAKSITGARSIDWKKEFEASEVAYDQKVLRVNNASNQDKEDTYTIYNMDNGDKIMDYTYGEMVVQIPNTSDKRFFAYFSRTNALGEDIEGGGVVEYASNTALIQKLHITAKANIEIPDYTPEIQILKVKNSRCQVTPDGKGVLLTNLSENYKTEEIKDFAFRINYYLQDQEEPYSIVLPVENDKLDLVNAIYDRAIFELNLID